MAENEVMEFQDGARTPRIPRQVFDQGSEPDPLYTLANERTYWEPSSPRSWSCWQAPTQREGWAGPRSDSGCSSGDPDHVRGGAEDR